MNFSTNVADSSPYAQICEKVNFCKYDDGLVPTIIQHSYSGKILMLGYMNAESLKHTLSSENVCFYSRSKQRLWVKGEKSKHYLRWTDISTDCDQDAILIKAIPQGPTCHLLTESCFPDQDHKSSFLYELQQVIADYRDASLKKEDSHSYTMSLFAAGATRIVQKFGEEAVETMLAASMQSRDHLIRESSDLVYHLLVMLSYYQVSLQDVINELDQRRSKKIDTQ